MQADSIVLGAAGFIGRHLVAELLEQGRGVAAGFRGPASRLTDWLDTRAVDRTRLVTFSCDITSQDLGLPTRDMVTVRDVYNLAANMAFGLSETQARLDNLTGALNVTEWAATLPALRRLVHVSGYRVSAGNAPEVSYAMGAYEASKVEADGAVRRRAEELGIALSVASPSGVVGAGQYFGLSDLVRDLWRGSLLAIPGRRDTFVPVVDVGYFAKFLASLPGYADTAGRSYTVLDSNTPDLPELVEFLAAHLGVTAPRRIIPAGVIRRLPRALTGADPESLEFISSDRYDTSAADEHAVVAGLTMPSTEQVLRHWADHLVAARFGATQPALSGGFHDGTWMAGDRTRPDYVLLHGLPVDSDSWFDVIAGLDGSVLCADLPGLGRSAQSVGSLDDWTTDLLRPIESKPVLVAHSLACGPAIRYAWAHPDKIAALVLVSPAFLQAKASWHTRSSLATAVLRFAAPALLARQLGVGNGPAIASAAANLRRPGAARRVVRALRKASAPSVRVALREMLEQLELPVRIIVGADDPLVGSTRHRVTTIQGTGHFPQLTHPIDIARTLATDRAMPSHAR